MLRTLSYLLLSFLLFSNLGCQQQTPADLVVQNGTIYTVNEAQPQAEAVAVIDGKIAFVGSAAEAENWIGDETQVLDLQGKTMTPGFIEGHAHFLGVGENKMNLDLLAVRSFEEIAAMVAEAAAEAPLD
jgi:predicted amidohydrolase YtcJ